MKKLRLLALLLVATVPFAACDDDGGTQPESGSIQGTVVVEGSPLSGVTVAISGPESATATTDANGEYTFQSVPSGSYTIEIAGGAPDDVTFETPSKSATVSGGSTETVNFSGDYIRTAVISGRVTAQTESGEANVENITVSLSGTESATTQTDANGEFVFDGLRAGSYTVSIDASGLDIEFNTTSQQVQVSVGGSAEVNFTGLQPAAAQVSIEEIYGANNNVPVNRANVAGVIYVDVTMDPGTETITRVSIALNGEEVDAQTMNVSGGSSPAATSAQPVVQFQISTQMFDPQTLEVAYPNGEYELSASIETAEGSTATATLGTPLRFNNTDILRVVAVETNSVVSGGVRWYGQTDQTLRAEAILYSQQVEIDQIGVSPIMAASTANGGQAMDLGAGPGSELLIEGPAPFEFVIEADDNNGAGGVEDSPAGSGSQVTITSVNDPDGVDIVSSFSAPSPFMAYWDWVPPAVNTPAASEISVAGTAIAGGEFFSGGAFGLTNNSELGVGGLILEFDVDDAATSADPDFDNVSAIADLPERQPSNFTTKVLKVADALQNEVDLTANAVSGGDNESPGYGVDRTAVAITDIFPAPGSFIVLNPDDDNGDGNNQDLEFTANDPALADGTAGSGYNTTTVTVTNTSTGAQTPASVGPNTAGANTINTDPVVTVFSEARYTVEATTTDNATAPNQVKTVWEVAIDATDPTTNMLNPPSSNVTSSNSTLTFTISGNASDANGLSEVLVTVRNADDGTADVCELTDALIPVGSNPGQVNQNSVDVTGSAEAGFDVDIRVNNNETNATDGDGEDQDLCFFIESSDNAKDNTGASEPNTSDQSARTVIDWRP